MTWNEQDHPRDEDGKFTFKNGGMMKERNQNPAEILYGKKTKEEEHKNHKTPPFKLEAKIDVSKKNNPKTPAEILYRQTKKQEEEKKAENKYKKILLDTLGNMATPGMVLLGTTKQLEKTIKENGLWNKVKQKAIEAGIGKLYGPLINSKITEIYGPDTAGMLDMAHKKRINPEYTKDAIKIKSYNDIQNQEDKKYLVKKLNEQYREYTDITNIENIEGYNFKENSEPSQRIAKDKDFQNAIKNNREKILKGENASGNFPSHGTANKDNLHNALGHFDIRNGKIDKQGNLHIKVYDTYDFNKNNKSAANQAGYSQMHKGNLIPYFTIHEVLIPKNELDKIWNED